MFRGKTPRRRSNLSTLVQSNRNHRGAKKRESEIGAGTKDENQGLEGTEGVEATGTLVQDEPLDLTNVPRRKISSPGLHGGSVGEPQISIVPEKLSKDSEDAAESSQSSAKSESSESESLQSQSQLADGIPAAFLEHLMNFSLFQNAPQLFYVAIARKLKLMVYHAHEFVVKAGEPALAMYWILRGSVNVTSPDGEIVHAQLMEGSYFGEIGILFNRPRTATVVSSTKILLGVLTAENFNQVLVNFPQIERQIRDEAQERLATQEKQRKAGLKKILHDDDFLSRKISPSCLSTDTIYSAFSQNAGLFDSPPLIHADLDANASQKLDEEVLLPPQLPKSGMNSKTNSPNAIHKSTNHIYTETIDDTISAKQFLKGLPLFATLPAEITHQLALSVEVIRVPPFEYVFHKNDIGEDIYFIISGEVEVLGPSSAPDSVSTQASLPQHKKIDVVLARLGPGQYFGEMGFLNSITGDLEERAKCKRSADIRTVSNSTLLVLTGDTLRDFCARFPETEVQIKRTADERIKKNKDLQSESPFDKLSNSIDANKILAPVSRKCYIDILHRPSTQLERDNTPTSNRSHATSSASENGGGNLNSNDAKKNDTINNQLFKKNFSFDKESEEVVGRKSDSPSKNLVPAHSPSFTPVSVISGSACHKSPFATTSAASGKTGSSSNNHGTFIPHPLELHVPPLNGTSKRKNSIFSATSPSPIQYMSHSKRLRLANAGGGPSRRRSSVLSVGPLPDRLLLRCFEFIPLPELMKLRLVCRRWRQLLYVAPGLFNKLDLTKWNRWIDDKALQKITEFVGSRPEFIDISDCFHLTDEGFSYMINEVGIGGNIRSLKMRSCWEISAMSIMDIAVPSIGQVLQEIDLSNCGKVRDDVIQRLIGWDVNNISTPNEPLYQVDTVGSLYPLNEPIPGMEDFSAEGQHAPIRNKVIGCGNLHKMVLRHCKSLTDLTLYHMSLYAKDRLTYLDLTRCVGLTDIGFSYWSYQSFPKLTTLNVSECVFLTDSSIRSIVNSCPRLSHLDLSFCCSLTDLAIELLCYGCQHLQVLRINFCGRAISDVSLLNISMHLRSLQEVYLKGCLRVTRSGVDSLLGGYAPLRKIDISQCKNAHIYQGGVQATSFKTAAGSRSVFLTMEDSLRCIEVII